MKVVLLRVGMDSGCRPIQANGPLLPDGSFELMPIPDQSAEHEDRTYGNTVGRLGRPLVDYFPNRRAVVADLPMHVDPEFDTNTYGTPTRLQRRLATLEDGDLLVFYGGLRPVTADGTPIPNVRHALYLFGYFDVACAVRARDYTRDELLPMFGANFHVRHPDLFENQQDELVLVKGTATSRLLEKARLLSETTPDRRGTPIFVLSAEMRAVFGTLSGVGSIQRSAPRWIDPAFAERAGDFVQSLP